jgi:hypothetical protein
VLKKKIWANFQRIIELFTKKIVKKLLKIWSWDPGSEFRDPEKTYSGSRIPDPGVKKHPIPDPQHWNPDPKNWFLSWNSKVSKSRNCLLQENQIEKETQGFSVVPYLFSGFQGWLGFKWTARYAENTW